MKYKELTVLFLMIFSSIKAQEQINNLSISHYLQVGDNIAIGEPAGFLKDREGTIP